MTDTDNRSPLLGRLVALLPILMIALLVTGSGLFCAVSILPQWRLHEQLVADLDAKRENASLQTAGQDENISVLEQQIAGAEEALGEAASVFLSRSQAEDLIDALYHYASESGVQITSIESQQSASPQEAPAATVEDPTYDVYVFRLKAAGAVQPLIGFVTRLREASVPAVTLQNLSITTQQEQTQLVMDIFTYISPFAAGTALDNLPTLVFSPPVSTPPTPTPIPTTGAALPPDVTSTSPAPTPAADACPGAQPSLFKVGDVVVVDFNETGALRILAEVGENSVDALKLAYDNDLLHILDGPACGVWQGANIWYWFVEGKGVQGWVGEAGVTDRWICPLSNPECA